MKRFAAGAVYLALCVCTAYGQAAVPPAYQDLYNQLDSQISAFETTIRSSWNGSPYPFVNSAHVLSADSENSTSLLNSNYYDQVVAPELNQLAALGVKSVTTHINFPVLYRPYYNDQNEFQSYVSFYQQFAANVHARGLKLIIESSTNTDLAGTDGGQYAAYYASLSWTAFMNGRAQHNVNIAQLIQPDYLSVVNEPDSEADDAKQPNAGTIDGCMQELGVILGALNSAGVTIPIGAGADTWISSFSSWMDSFAAQPISYIDIHIYPPNRSFLTNALSAADTAHAAGKGIAVSEAWCEKIRDSELGVTIFNDMEARYVFSFWAPIDTSFAQAMVDMAQYKKFEFVSLTWSRYFFAYLDYNTYGSITDDDTLENDAAAAAKAANETGSFTSTGIAWLKMIRPPDTTAPATPAAPAGGGTHTGVYFSWPATTDNVGVAGYNVYRDGKWLAATSNLDYLDSTADAGQTYCYVITAFDASGNESHRSPCMPSNGSDKNPPSVPKNLTGIALSDRSIRISWDASKDDSGVAGYSVYRGTSPSNLVSVGSVTATYAIDNSSLVLPKSTFYYAVAAYDIYGNVSKQTGAVAVTTPPDTTPPTVPGQLAATAVSMNQINLSWAPSSDDVTVTGYLVYRGLSASSLSLVATVSTAGYLDSSLAAGTAYYYSVAASDEASNLSPKSPIVSATTLTDTQAPSRPGNLSGSAVPGLQINLTWSASTDNVAVAGYRVFRGTSPQTLAPIATVARTAYSDKQGLSAGATYFYAVAAFDASGNFSPRTGSIDVKATQ